jgi:hypothetical protein
VEIMTAFSELTIQQQNDVLREYCARREFRRDLLAEELFFNWDCNSQGLYSGFIPELWENVIVKNEESAVDREHYHDDAEDLKEIFQILNVDKLFFNELSASGQAVLKNEYGFFWARTGYGQEVSQDEAIRKTFANLDDSVQQSIIYSILEVAS